MKRCDTCWYPRYYPDQRCTDEDRKVCNMIDEDLEYERYMERKKEKLARDIDAWIHSKAGDK